MDIEQCAILIKRMGEHFPFWYRALSAQSIVSMAEDWSMILGDLEPRIVAAAIAQLLAEPRDFPPMVGHINVKARELAARARGDAPEMDAGEAWRRVCQAVTGFGNGAAWDAERRAALPAAAVRAAEDFGLMRIRTRLDENAGTDFAQYRDIYNALAQRERSQRATPPAVRQLMQDLAKQLSAERDRKQLPGGE